MFDFNFCLFDRDLVSLLVLKFGGWDVVWMITDFGGVCCSCLHTAGIVGFWRLVKFPYLMVVLSGLWRFGLFCFRWFLLLGFDIPVY